MTLLASYDFRLLRGKPLGLGPLQLGSLAERDGAYVRAWQNEVNGVKLEPSKYVYRFTYGIAHNIASLLG